MPGYEGLYRVSDEGDIWSERRPRARGGLLRQYDDGHGYPSVTLTSKGVQKRFGVHQVVALAFLGPRPEGSEVRHRDGNPQNRAASNLLYGTHGENMQDMALHGTSNTGRRTHCPARHEYTPANTRIYKGRRFCKECARKSSRESQRRRRARLRAA